MRKIRLLPPLITARWIEVYCSSQNIRLRVRGPSHCCIVHGLGEGGFSVFVLFSRSYIICLTLDSHVTSTKFCSEKKTKWSRTNQLPTCETMPFRFGFNSSTQYMKENKVELNVALEAKEAKQSKFSYARSDTGLAKINFNQYQV